MEGVYTGIQYMLHPVNLKPSSEHKLMLMIIKHEFKYHTVVNRTQHNVRNWHFTNSHNVYTGIWSDNLYQKS